MRVFVVGTGRCGTTTFFHACSHMTNFTAAHESTTGMRSASALLFPDQHIEVNPHLSWMLGPLLKHVDPKRDLFVHLQRRKEEVIESWVQRSWLMGPGKWAPLAMRTDPTKHNEQVFRVCCELNYDAVTSQIDCFLKHNKLWHKHLWLHDLVADPDTHWRSFWDYVGALGDYNKSIAEWKVKHNATKSR